MDENKKKLIRCLLSLTVIWLVVNAFSKIVEAEEGIGFSYVNVIPKNQMSEGSYFDLLVKPKASQTLVTEIKNESLETIKIKLSINDSTTTQTGTIEYGPSSLKNRKGEYPKLTEMLTGPTEITLKKGEVQTVELKLTVPDEVFEGVILGGVQLERIMAKTESEKAVSVKNKYAYAFSVSIRESDKLLAPKLENLGGSYSSVDGKEQVKIELENQSQEIVKNMKMTTIISKKDSNKVLLEDVLEDMKMAPQSIMDYRIDFPNVEAGSYVAKTNILVGKKVFSWENFFEVSEGEERSSSRKLDVTKDEQVNYLGIVAIIATIIIGTGIIFLVIKLY